MKYIYCFAFLTLLFNAGFSQNIRSNSDLKKNISDKSVHDQINNLPVSFRKNSGQWDDKIIYRGFSPGWNANINFLKNGLSFGLSREVEAPEEKKTDPSEHKSLMDVKVKPREHLIWNLYFRGMNSGASVTSDGQQESHASYFIGNDPSKYQVNVPDYRALTYHNVYDNVDIKYYSTGKNIKYDCMIKPGGDVNKIRMACEGIKQVKVNARKQLEITNAWGTLIEEMPESYQIINGEKRLVQVEYVSLNDSTFGFRITGNYDHSQTLVIDPVILAWSTFVGASGGDEGYSYAVAVDPAGNVYCTGFYTANFPVTAGAFGASALFVQNVIVYKLNPTATTLLYATYLGSNSSDWGYGIVVNSAGEAYVTGRTGATNFPVTAGAFQTVPGGSFDVFVTKLNATGTGLIYSTLIGGSNGDEGYDIKINAAGEAFITGVASKAGFPYTPGAFQTTLIAGYGALVAKLNATGTALIYAGILGGNLGNYGYGIAIDPTGAAYVTGETGSWVNNPPSYTDFPLTPGAFDMTYGNCGWKGFVTKINPAGTAMVYSSLIGGKGTCPGTGQDQGRAIAVNAAGEAFITGNTGSNDFPTSATAFDKTYSMSDAFVMRVNAAGSALIYSSYYGGSMGESATGIAVNSSNEAFISGYTETDNGTFPITSCAFQKVFGGQSTANIRGDLYLAKISATGSTLQYSTFIGGNSDDYQIPKIVLFGACEEEVIMNGTSHSANFPTTAGVFQPTKLNGGDDQHVVFKMKPKVNADFTYTKPPCSLTVTFTDSSYGNCVWQSTAWTPSTWLWNFGDGTTSTQQNPVHTYSALGTYSVTLVISCPKDSITLPVIVSNSSLPSSTSTTICSGATATLTAGGGISYSWNTGATTSSINVSPTSNTTYSVIVDNGGCKDTIPMNVVVSGVVLTYSVTPANCFGSNDGTSTISASGGTSPYNYSWSSGGTNATATGLSAGNYTVTVTDASGGCASTQTVNITQPALLTTTVSSTPDGCGANSGTATVAASGGTGAYTYLWDNAAGTSTITGLAGGNYSITVTDANGCTAVNTASVTSIGSVTATAGPSTTICSGQSITMAATGGVNYSWNTGATTSSFNITPGVSASYSVIVSIGNCVDTAYATVVVNPSASVTVTGNTTLCLGDITTLTATGTGNYSWSTGASTSVITDNPVSTTTYIVTAANANGCSAVDTVIVTVAQPPVAAAANLTICQGQTATLSASGGGNYSWSNGSTSAQISVSPSSTSNYTVIVSIGSCSDTANATITVYPVSTAAAWSSTVISYGSSTTLAASGGGSYSWSNGSVDSLLTVSPIITTIYCVTVSNVNTCPDTACVTVSVEPINCSPVSSEDAFVLPSAFSPNADGENDSWRLLYVPLLKDCIADFKVAVYNRWGEKVFEGTDIAFSWDGYYNGKIEETAVFGYYIEGTLKDGKKIKKKGNISLLR